MSRGQRHSSSWCSFLLQNHVWHASLLCIYIYYSFGLICFHGQTDSNGNGEIFLKSRRANRGSSLSQNASLHSERWNHWTRHGKHAFKGASTIAKAGNKISHLLVPVCPQPWVHFREYCALSWRWKVSPWGAKDRKLTMFRGCSCIVSNYSFIFYSWLFHVEIRVMCACVSVCLV